MYVSSKYISQSCTDICIPLIYDIGQLHRSNIKPYRFEYILLIKPLMKSIYNNYNYDNFKKRQLDKQ